MSNKLKVWLLFIFIIMIASASIINFFIWPFKADTPNFSDVDKAFRAINVPVDWKLIDLTENKGTAGRTCPIEGSGCFSKRGLFSLPEGTDVTDITEFLNSAGCKSIATSDTSSKNGKTYTFYCRLKEGIKLGSDYEVDKRELYLSIRTY